MAGRNGMDRRERVENLQWTLSAVLEGFQAEMWTALPAIVESFNPAAMTVAVKPAIRGRVRSVDDNPPLPPQSNPVLDKDNWWWADMPIIGDVPVVFPSGGGFTMTFPLFPGDNVLLVFSSRCIDAHWQSGGVQNQAPELRMNDLSDAFAIPGHRPLPAVPLNVSDSTLQIRSDDGGLYVELTRTQICNIVAPGGVNITGPLNVTGDVSIVGQTQTEGDVTVVGNSTFQGSMIANGHVIDETHVHSGVTPGGSNSGPVT